MERIVIVAILGLLIFIAIQMTKQVEVLEDIDDFVGEVEKGDCEACSLTSLEPKRVCPSGMCSMKGRTGCKV